jgi:DNA-binding NtrC family response regulator
MLSLVVDDDEAVRSFIQSILHSENFETLEAEDGSRAFEMVRMLSGNVDLIVTDIQMPGCDGITFARAVRAAYPFVPIILVSGYGDPDGDFEFIEKPFSWAMLARVVRRVMANAALTAERRRPGRVA